MSPFPGVKLAMCVYIMCFLLSMSTALRVSRHTTNQNCTEWLSTHEHLPVLEPGDALKDETITSDQRLALLCRSWLLYTNSKKDLLDRATPTALMGRVTMNTLDTSKVGSLPLHMKCPTLDNCWPELEAGSNHGWNGVLPVLGYGSLMNAPADGQVGSSEPVIAVANVLRTAVLLHPEPEESPYGYSSKAHQDREVSRYTADFIDPENMQDFSGGPSILMNGVVQFYDLRDSHTLDGFRDREVGYDLMQVPVVRVSDVLADGQVQPFQVFVLRQSHSAWARQERLASNAHGPHLLYVFNSMDNDEAKFGQGFNRLVGDSTIVRPQNGFTLAEYIQTELKSTDKFVDLEKP